MSLPTTLFHSLRRTPENTFSKPDVSVLVLFASFVSHLLFRHFEPSSTLSRVAPLVVLPTLLSLPISHTFSWPLYAVLPLAFITYGTGLVFFTLAYRLSPFHPLAKYPGPLMAKSSKWWAVYINIKGDLHRYYRDAHDRYGDVVRIGPNELSIRDASLIHSVLGRGGLPRGPRWDGRPGPPLIGQRDPMKHVHQRKPWNRAFSSEPLKEYEVIVAKRTRQLVGCLESLVHKSGRTDDAVLDITAWFNYFSTDFLGDMAFGGAFELMKAGGDNDGVLETIGSGSRIIETFAHVPYVIPFFRAVTGQNGFLQRSRAFAREHVLKRLSIGANRKDLFYYLSGEELPEPERPSMRDVAQDGLLAITAGSSTGTILTSVIYYLVLNPAAYVHLQAEIDSAFSNEEEPLDVPQLCEMEWLNGCINEALRLQPTVPTGSQRSVNKGMGPKALGKLVIPEGTQLSLNTYCIHRDARYFHTPNAFIPDRWFSKKDAGPTLAAGEHNVNAFFPFSHGPTICPGKNLALLEMRMVLCWVLRRFRFSKAPGFAYEEWEGKNRDWFVIHLNPLPVQVSIRE